MTTADDLRDFAAEAGIGAVGIDLFSYIDPSENGTMDNPPDPVAIFRSYGSEPDVMVYEQRTPALVAPRTQVVVRSHDVNAAVAMAGQLYDLFYQSNTRIGAGYYTMLRPMGEPFPIGPDPNNRQQIAFNVRCQRYF